MNGSEERFRSRRYARRSALLQRFLYRDEREVPWSVLGTSAEGLAISLRWWGRCPVGDATAPYPHEALLGSDQTVQGGSDYPRPLQPNEVTGPLDRHDFSSGHDLG